MGFLGSAPWLPLRQKAAVGQWGSQQVSRCAPTVRLPKPWPPVCELWSWWLEGWGQLPEGGNGSLSRYFHSPFRPPTQCCHRAEAPCKPHSRAPGQESWRQPLLPGVTGLPALVSHGTPALSPGAELGLAAGYGFPWPDGLLGACPGDSG